MDYADTKEMADRLGLRFDPGQNYSFADDYEFLPYLSQRRQPLRVQHSVRHPAGKVKLLVFDYHYELSGKGADMSFEASIDCLTTAMALCQAYFPELRIAPEGLLSKIAEALGEDDIQFESAEFSGAFRVRSKDKKFAYDVCNRAGD